jgi:hypothetical protein
VSFSPVYLAIFNPQIILEDRGSTENGCKPACVISINHMLIPTHRIDLNIIIHQCETVVIAFYTFEESITIPKH